ncbi:MAG TPA: NAD(P)-dependent oxidoreductase [Xanthobacteraceae bacterium]|nr:NAD(P)-dependent oxidoreductase [Xanthobacteraceae bacterium]
MKVGFVGVGGMGQVMACRLLEAGHEVAVYNRTPEKTNALTAHGARAVASLAEAAKYGEAVFTMVTDDAAVIDVAGRAGGLLASLPKGGIHICSGTHSVAAMRRLAALHADAGQLLIAAPMLGRPEVVASGQGSVLIGGAKEAVERCRPLFAAIARRSFDAGADPAAAAAIKLTHNLVLGCAIEAMGEGFAVVRKYGVAPEVFYDVLTEGLFGCSAYKVYGKFIVEDRYLPAGHKTVVALKDANLALAAAEAVSVPLPSGNALRDRLIGAIAHGEGDHDWAVVAREQARASGLL